MAQPKKTERKLPKRCWEFLQCPPEVQRYCLTAEAQDQRCWLSNLPCRRIGKDIPRPISVKKIICKTCDYYKKFKV